MKYKLLILILGMLSCKSEQKPEVNNEIQKPQNVDVIIKKEIINDTIERFFPLEKETIKNDTLIENQNIQISIIRKALDSYVVNEFDSDGVKNIHKYRDFENHLKIKKDAEILIDTIFRKRNFIENTGKEFQEISIFHGYWFREIKDNRIELFGVISKPETDYTYAFQHFFDIKSGKFEIKNSIDEEY